MAEILSWWRVLACKNQKLLKCRCRCSKGFISTLSLIFQLWHTCSLWKTNSILLPGNSWGLIDKSLLRVYFELWGTIILPNWFFFVKLQVSLPHYRRECFLQDSITRYRMYLHLKSKHPEKFLVPCYDIDVVWHTHQVKWPYYYKYKY